MTFDTLYNMLPGFGHHRASFAESVLDIEPVTSGKTPVSEPDIPGFTFQAAPALKCLLTSDASDAPSRRHGHRRSRWVRAHRRPEHRAKRLLGCGDARRRRGTRGLVGPDCFNRASVRAEPNLQRLFLLPIPTACYKDRVTWKGGFPARPGARERPECVYFSGCELDLLRQR